MRISPTAGINAAELGAQPVMTYQVMGGGRFFPSVSREVKFENYTYEVDTNVNGINSCFSQHTNDP